MDYIIDKCKRHIKKGTINIYNKLNQANGTGQDRGGKQERSKK